MAFTNFIKDNITAFEVLSQAPWASFYISESTWLIQGRATQAPAQYALLITNMQDVWFVFADTPQIETELTHYNAGITGQLAGIMENLNLLISKQDFQARYNIDKKNPDILQLEIIKMISNIYEFKWRFELMRLNQDLNAEILRDYLLGNIMKLFSAQENYVNELEQKLKTYEPSNRQTKQPLSTKRIVNNQPLGFPKIEFSQLNLDILQELQTRPIDIIKEEEKKREELVRKRPIDDLGLKPIKRVKGNIPIQVNYQETSAERERKAKLERKLTLKKKKNIGFL